MSDKYFKFHALIEVQDDIYVAQCLETGSIVTADTMDTAFEIMDELLQDEVMFAVANKNLENLYSTTAPSGVWERWYSWSLKTVSRAIYTFPYDLICKKILEDTRKKLKQLDFNNCWKLQNRNRGGCMPLAAIDTCNVDAVSSTLITSTKNHYEIT